MLSSFLLVAAGGAAGSVLRYAVGLWLKPAPDTAFPLSTLVVNLVGAFLIGVLAGYASRYTWASSGGWLLLATGLCGGFTTFSAFSLEGVRMLQGGAIGPALLYLGGSVFLGLALCALGARLTACFAPMPQFQFQFTRTTKAALPAAARDLILAATDAARMAYAPYSNFPVGAAARLSDGRILTGSNHENASSPVGICAERALLAGLDMRTPECAVKELAVIYDGKPGGAPISPCGMCRQSILEVQHWQGCAIRLYLCAPGDEVIVVDDAEWLLPFAFSGEMLG